MSDSELAFDRDHDGESHEEVLTYFEPGFSFGHATFEEN